MNEDTMFEIETSLKNVYGWKVVGSEATPPEMIMPQCAKDRIAHFWEFQEYGLSFLGCLKFILADDEEECKKEFEWGMGDDWLPPSEDFKLWRNRLRNMRELEVAAYLLYGPLLEKEETK